MLILYSSSGCASCRKAKQWLRDNHIEFIEKNIYTTLMKEDEIKYLLSRCENGTQDIISLRSKVYRSLKKDFNELSTNELIRLIQNNPSILKRPIILSKNNMVVGFDDEEITVTDATTADDIEEWDSLEHINLLAAVEQEFGMKFNMGQVVSMKNVGEMADIIMSKIG